MPISNNMSDQYAIRLGLLQVKQFVNWTAKGKDVFLPLCPQQQPIQRGPIGENYTTDQIKTFLQYHNKTENGEREGKDRTITKRY